MPIAYQEKSMSTEHAIINTMCHESQMSKPKNKFISIFMLFYQLIIVVSNINSCADMHDKKKMLNTTLNSVNKPLFWVYYHDEIFQCLYITRILYYTCPVLPECLFSCQYKSLHCAHIQLIPLMSPQELASLHN